jgi:hypothetical protein
MERGDLSQPEKFIENAILDYLALRNVFAWKIKSVGTFDPVEKKFRRPSKRYMKGVFRHPRYFQREATRHRSEVRKRALKPSSKIVYKSF